MCMASPRLHTRPSRRGGVHNRLLSTSGLLLRQTSQILKGLHLYFPKFVCSSDNPAGSDIYCSSPHVRNGSWHFTWMISLPAHRHSLRDMGTQDSESTRPRENQRGQGSRPHRVTVGNHSTLSLPMTMRCSEPRRDTHMPPVHTMV